MITRILSKLPRTFPKRQYSSYIDKDVKEVGTFLYVLFSIGVGGAYSAIACSDYIENKEKHLSDDKKLDYIENVPVVLSAAAIGMVSGPVITPIITLNFLRKLYSTKE